MSKQVGILVFDIGTTGVKSVLFHETGRVMGTSTQKMKTTYPSYGLGRAGSLRDVAGCLKGIHQYKIQYEKFLRLYHPFRDLCYIMKDM